MEKKEFYECNGQNLCGILNQQNNNDLVTIICHARTSNKDSKVVREISKILSANDLNSFRFDFVACGESDGHFGDYNVTNMIDNLNTTLEYLSKKFNYKRFILIGCSMGGRIVSLVNYQKYNIEKLILIYPALNYHRFRKLFLSAPEKEAKKYGIYKGENNWQFDYNYFQDERKYNAFKVLCKWDVPKLFIHGTKDKYVSYKKTIRVSKKCKKTKLVLIKDGDHGFHNEKHLNEALENIVSFIKIDGGVL